MSMSEPKPFASLSSGLLARKGAAKPAMRPQGFGHLGASPEDLGWNDMGYGLVDGEPIEVDLPEHVPSSISALTPAPRPEELGPEGYVDGQEYDEETGEIEEESLAGARLPVADQHLALQASFPPQPIEAPTPVRLASQVSRPADVVPLPRRPRQAAGLKEKAAFTLRLDRERHLKLRLACAIKHRSAQQIVSEALDKYLKSLPELDSLAQHVPSDAAKRN
jgi:hypothetical protein